MSRGVKLDLFIGKEIEDGWTKLDSTRKTQLAEEILDPAKHSLHFQKEKRRGKVVTLIGRFMLSSQDASALLTKLKKTLGCGGAFKDGFMEFQGEPKERLRELLVEQGFRFKSGH